MIAEYWKSVFKFYRLPHSAMKFFKIQKSATNLSMIIYNTLLFNWNMFVKWELIINQVNHAIFLWNEGSNFCSTSPYLEFYLLVLEEKLSFFPLWVFNWKFHLKEWLHYMKFRLFSLQCGLSMLNSLWSWKLL